MDFKLNNKTILFSIITTRHTVRTVVVVRVVGDDGTAVQAARQHELNVVEPLRHSRCLNLPRLRVRDEEILEIAVQIKAIGVGAACVCVRKKTILVNKVTES